MENIGVVLNLEWFEDNGEYAVVTSRSLPCLVWQIDIKSSLCELDNIAKASVCMYLDGDPDPQFFIKSEPLFDGERFYKVDINKFKELYNYIPFKGYQLGD